MIHVLTQISPDPTMTVEHVANVMEKVTMDKRKQMWERLLDKQKSLLTKKFGMMTPGMVPAIDIVDEIYSSHSNEKEKTHACSDTYVNCHPESSWEHVTSLLYEADEIAAVDQARPFLPPRGKFTTSKQNLKLVSADMRHAWTYVTIHGKTNHNAHKIVFEISYQVWPLDCCWKKFEVCSFGDMSQNVPIRLPILKFSSKQNEALLHTLYTEVNILAVYAKYVAPPTKTVS